MKRFLPIVILFFIVLPLKGQQLPLYSQYMMNSFLLNPAVSGHDGFTTFNLTAREQWLGFENSPRTIAFSGTTRLLRQSAMDRSGRIGRSSRRSGNVGLGGYIYNDRNGLIDRTGIQATYSYHISMGQNKQLSFGVSLTGFQLRIDDRNLNLYDDNDPLLNSSKNALYVPDANLGVYYREPEFYLGFSVAQLLESALKFGSDGFKDFKMERHLYLMGGYGLFIDSEVTVEPSLLVQSTLSGMPQVDINARIYYMDDYWAGVSYRSSGAFIMMGGVRVERLYFGYAFDYTLSSIRKHSFGSHEIMVSMRFGDSARRYRWLNRY